MAIIIRGSSNSSSFVEVVVVVKVVVVDDVAIINCIVISYLWYKFSVKVFDELLRRLDSHFHVLSLISLVEDISTNNTDNRYKTCYE